jgi:biopolymer transport protein ExbD
MPISRRRRQRSKPQMVIAPMIDVVFLMLIYFMVSSTLARQEADISFQLPGVVEQSTPLEMPDEQIIEIRADGRVFVNDFEYDSPSTARMVELTTMLSRFRQASAANKVEPAVTLQPDGQATHQMIVRVMDACSAAGIRNVNFGFDGDDR